MTNNPERSGGDVLSVLVGCEESQIVTKAFRAAKHMAYSCDILPTRGREDWHYQQDIMEVIPYRIWDLIVLHPDCTAMAVSGNRWYGRGKPLYHKRLAAIEWTLRLWGKARIYGKRVALENPVSVIFSHLSNVHYIQPWQFGHGETKKTGFALHNLEPLQPTNIVSGREHRIHRMPPGPNRGKDRSRTFQGIADAMANQWNF